MHLASFLNGFGTSRISAVSHPKEISEETLHEFQLHCEAQMMRAARDHNDANDIVEQEIRTIERLERKCGEVK